MTGIREWLQKLGLEHYAEAFESHEIDRETLPELSEQDLKELGLPIGPRRKVLKAIRESAVEPKPIEEREPGPAATARPHEAERRQITVMFCDMVGSTKLSGALDAEDLLEIMASFQKAVGTLAERYEGHVAQYLGDGLMIYFGWPLAHEDDAERALLASLAIIDATKNLAAPEPLQVRIGIATGPVVVGETGSGDASIPKAAVGGTPNVAARLQSLAAPDEILISSSTHRLGGDGFEYEDLGEKEFRGVSEPMRVWRVLAESGTEGRFKARSGGSLTPLVGRDSELSLMHERWSQSNDSEGQVFVVLGEPGIGKSRIADVLLAKLRDEPHTRLRYQCSPHYTSTAFYPVIDQLERAAGFERGESAESKLDKLESLLALGAENIVEVAPLVATMLSLTTERYGHSLALNPEQMKEKIFEALCEQTIGLARHKPVLMIWEDVHWADPTTLDLMTTLIERIQNAAVMLVITARPEFQPPWAGHNHVTIHTLNRLSRRQRAELVANVIGARTLPNDVIDQIIARTDGVPLFVEELTKSVIESGVGGAGIAGGRPGSRDAIPATLQDSLMARLDRLDSGKEIAQIGACIGRHFNYELLQRVSLLDDEQLRCGLKELVSVGLIHERGSPPESRYTFKHALIQDTAYQSLLKTTRQRLHATTAQVLTQHFPEIVETEPELLAYHFTGAALPAEAIANWQKAGERAVHRSANPEAVGHLRNGLALIPDLTDQAERDRLELALLTQLGPAMIATKGYGAPETASCYDRARALLKDDSAEFFPVLYGCWVNKVTWAEFPIARAMAEQFLSSANDQRDTAAILTGYRMLGFSLSSLGAFSAARENFEKVVTLYQPREHASLAYRYGQDPKAAADSMCGWNLWHLGYPDQAVDICANAVAYARELKHTNTRGYVETFGAARIHLFRGEREQVERYINSMSALFEEHKLVFWSGFIKTFEGWNLIQQGRYQSAIDVLQEGMRAHEETRTSMFKPHSYSLLAQAYAGDRRFDDSLRTLEQAFRISAQTGEAWIVAELHRLKGEILLGAGETADAASESCFVQSLSVAREHAAKSWELRAATSLARLRHSRRNRQEAKELLAPVYDWFTEGFDTKDLQDARTLLAALE